MTDMDRLWRLYREREFGMASPEMRERFFELDWQQAHAENQSPKEDIMLTPC